MKTTYSLLVRSNVKIGRKKSDVKLCNWTFLQDSYVSQEAARKAAQEFLPYVKIIKKTWEVVESLEA